MAENIYSKGTRVWFADKEQGWISAEVTNVAKGSGDKIKLSFVDDRGKVSTSRMFFCYLRKRCLDFRKSHSTQLQRLSGMAKMIYHLYEILLYWRRLTILLPYPILMSPQVCYLHSRIVDLPSISLQFFTPFETAMHSIVSIPTVASF
jgi:hypothetical protein